MNKPVSTWRSVLAWDVTYEPPDLLKIEHWLKQDQGGDTDPNWQRVSNYMARQHVDRTVENAYAALDMFIRTEETPLHGHMPERSAPLDALLKGWILS